MANLQIAMAFYFYKKSENIMTSIRLANIVSLIAPLFIIGCANANDIANSTSNNNQNNTQEIIMSDLPLVQLDTSMGEVVIELDAKAAPKTVANFLQYVEEGHYNGTIFHRVIPGFMVQGGGMDAQMKEKSTHAPISIESDNGLKNEVGTIAMARTQDPNSATSQFFINVADNGFLNYSSPTLQGWGYAVFGKVTSGMDVVHKIEGVATGRYGMHADVPKEPVIINSATIISK